VIPLSGCAVSAARFISIAQWRRFSFFRNVVQRSSPIQIWATSVTEPLSKSLPEKPANQRTHHDQHVCRDEHEIQNSWPVALAYYEHDHRRGHRSDNKQKGEGESRTASLHRPEEITDDSKVE
jgi:hypothetical protein